MWERLTTLGKFQMVQDQHPGSSSSSQASPCGDEPSRGTSLIHPQTPCIPFSHLLSPTLITRAGVGPGEDSRSWDKVSCGLRLGRGCRSVPFCPIGCGLNARE